MSGGTVKSRIDKERRERIMNSFPPFTFVAKSDVRTLKLWRRDEMLSPSIFEIEVAGISFLKEHH
jgi:hypothetical protein